MSGASERLLLCRFLQLFGSGRYREAALHAARTPGGILRNPDVMEMFAGDQLIRETDFSLSEGSSRLTSVCRCEGPRRRGPPSPPVLSGPAGHHGNGSQDVDRSVAAGRPLCSAARQAAARRARRHPGQVTTAHTHTHT